MVIEALPIIKAIDKAVGKKIKVAAGKTKKKSSVKIIFFSPAGKLADTSYVKEVAKKYTDIVFVCGRYEGIDARVKKAFKMEDISVGPFVLTGGELPAMLLIDTISRQINGVLGSFDSLEESRVASSDVYTRPEVIEFKGKKYRVPKVLLSGNHADIEKWKLGKNMNKRRRRGAFWCYDRVHESSAPIYIRSCHSFLFRRRGRLPRDAEAGEAIYVVE